jgi:hypothetical protein
MITCLRTAQASVWTANCWAFAAQFALPSPIKRLLSSRWICPLGLERQRGTFAQPISFCLVVFYANQLIIWAVIAHIDVKPAGGICIWKPIASAGNSGKSKKVMANLILSLRKNIRRSQNSMLRKTPLLSIIGSG